VNATAGKRKPRPASPFLGGAVAASDGVSLRGFVAHLDRKHIARVVGGCRRISQNTNRKTANSFTVSDGGCQEAIG